MYWSSSSLQIWAKRDNPFASYKIEKKNLFGHAQRKVVTGIPSNLYEIILEPGPIFFPNKGQIEHTVFKL